MVKEAFDRYTSPSKNGFTAENVWIALNNSSHDQNITSRRLFTSLNFATPDFTYRFSEVNQGGIAAR